MDLHFYGKHELLKKVCNYTFTVNIHCLKVFATFVNNSEYQLLWLQCLPEKVWLKQQFPSAQEQGLGGGGEEESDRN